MEQRQKTIMQRLRALLLTSRPVSWPNTAFPFAAGYLMTTRQVDLTLILGTLYFLIPFNLMMYGVNDVFDYESDIRNPRKGGIEGALLQRRDHRFVLATVAAVNLPFVALLLAQGGVASAIALLAVVGTALAYSLPRLRFKERAFIDSLTSSSHFTGPLVYGLTFAGFTWQSVLICVCFYLWGMASHAFGAIQDIQADREGGIGSVATTIGARSTVWFALALYTLSGLGMLVFGWPGVICAALAGLYIANVWPYRNITDKTAPATNRGWKRFMWINWVTGFVVTQLLIYLCRH